MFYILARCPYYNEGRKEREKTGIKRLLSNGTYAAAFPLHDVRQKKNTADKYNRQKNDFISIKQEKVVFK